MTLHWNHIEGVFVVVSIVVMLVEMYCVLDTTKTQEVTGRADERRKMVADSDNSQAWAKLTKAFVMLGVSLMALYLEPPPPSYSQVPQTVVYTIGWIMVGGVMVFSSAVRIRSQRRLRAKAARAVMEELAVARSNNHTAQQQAHES